MLYESRECSHIAIDPGLHSESSAPWEASTLVSAHTLHKLGMSKTIFLNPNTFTHGKTITHTHTHTLTFYTYTFSLYSFNSLYSQHLYLTLFHSLTHTHTHTHTLTYYTHTYSLSSSISL